ncbi:MAG TPA: DUF21 domain-containing protein [Candidatus Salinicoccus merdavium]|nr:DUF21 domain-containing protein [Candidatus Salinicoccus merdavium]
MVFLIIFLLFASLFFSGSETALTAVDKVKLQAKVQDGDKKAAKLLRVVAKPGEFITTILIGNNIANILLPTVVTAMAIDYGWSVAIASAAVTVTIILFAEVIPKSVAAAFPEQISHIVRPPITLIIIIFKPLTIMLNFITDNITKVLSRGEQPAWTVSKDELVNLIDIANAEGVLKVRERNRIKGILDFRDLNVKDIMSTPRTEMDAIKVDSSYDEVLETVVSLMHTRYPIYDENLDDIVGVFHTKYLLKWSLSPEKNLIDFADPDPLTVKEFDAVETVLRKMTKERRHLAIVLDEYGGTEGIVTHEDIIENMLGFDIEDETDVKGDALVDKMTKDEIICDGRITLHRLNTQFETEIPEEEDTLSGYLFKEFNDIPVQGDVYKNKELGLRFEVVVMESQTIRTIRILKEEPEDDENDDSSH